MKKDILKYIFFGLTLFFGFFAWFSVYRAIKIPDSSTWVVPGIFFSLYVISFCLAAVLARREIKTEIVAAVSMLFSLIFAQSIWHFVISFFCIIVMLCALRKICEDLDLNVKISLWKSFNTGKFLLIFSLAFLISSQYFFIIKNMDGQKNIPKFDISKVSSKFVEQVLGILYPDFKKLQQDSPTLDQFLIESGNFSSEEAKVYQQIPENLPADQREEIRKEISEELKKQEDLFFKSQHEQYSQQVGQEINGNEKMADISAGIINKRINDYFQTPIGGDSQSSLFPYILAAVLFLTVWPLGSVLGSLCFVAVVLLFKIFVYSGLVKIDKAMVEREVIA